MSCRKDVDSAKGVDSTLAHSGAVYTYIRRSQPNQIDVEELYDTLALSVKVKAQNGSIFIQPDTAQLFSFLAGKIKDSVGHNHTYLLNPYRPIVYYQFNKDTLMYFYNFTATVGSDAEIIMFFGTRL